MTNFRKSIIHRMGFSFIFLTVCLYLAWFTRPLKPMSFQEVFKSKEISNKQTAEDPTEASKCNKRVQGIGSNENNLYLYKVLNKKVLNNFAMVKKKAFYITPPFELHTKVSRHSPHGHAEESNVMKKDLLEQFTMKRKEAFYITPPFDYETIKPQPDTDRQDESSDTGSEKEDHLGEEPVEKLVNRRVRNRPDPKSVLDIQDNPEPTKDKDKPKPVTNAQDLKNSVPNITNSSVSNVTDKVAAKSYDYDITFDPNIQFVTPYIARNQESDIINFNITDLTKKQASIINQLNSLGGDKAQVEKYNQQFNALMQALQAQKAYASSTVMIMLDETDVKNKLRGDPFVQRVLKMAKRRKDEYFKKAKEEALKTLRINT